MLSRRYPSRRAFVTGAGSGLGRAIALALARDGWTVGLAERNETTLQDTAAAVRQAGGTPVPVPLDVTDPDAFRDAADAFVRAHGGVDLVINNAGIASAGTMEEIPLATWHATLDVNLRGMVYGCRAFVPHLKRQGAGHLVNVASIAGVAAAPRMSAYNVSKAGVIALSETLHPELAVAGVDVSVVMPAFFSTNIGAAMEADEGDRAMTQRLLDRSGLTADDAAREVLKGVAKRRIHILFPAQARAVWRFKRAAPGRYVRSLKRVVEKAEAFRARRATRDEA